MTIDDQKLVEQCEAGIKTLAGVDEWVRANPQAAGSSGEALLRESNRLARAPVCYTHLDVYKRQPPKRRHARLNGPTCSAKKRSGRVCWN